MATTNLSLPTDTLGPFKFARSFKAAMALIDAALGNVLTGSKTYDPASLDDAASATTTVTVTGATLGDIVTGVSFSLDLQAIELSGYVSAADTVTVYFRNRTGGTLNLASGTLKAIVRKAA